TELANGDRIWRLQIHCPEARSINLTYSDFYLPKGASFYLYNPSRSKVLGAFTHYNNHASRTFATNLIEDPTSILEYYEPAAVKGKGNITIDRIVHGYRFIRSIEAEANQEKGFNDSGACNVNVNCPEGDDWQDQKKSVARMVMIGSLCSGALINNQTQDCKPYFLTANHCTSGFSAAQMNQFIFQFNYESPNCTNINGPTNQSVTGASLKANLAASDFALLELNSEPPPEYNVYYAGWSNSPTAAPSVTGIHHPAGDIKKICIENQPVTTSGNEWRVDDWDVGVTEGGSSGSPLFNPEKRIVGQLFGGSAACSGTNDNGLPDFYGKFSHSWDAGGLASNELQGWLDPNNTGVVTLDRRYCDDPYCETTGNTGSPFISNVTVNGIAHNSGNDGGYGDYKDITFTVTEGETNSVSLGGEGLALACSECAYWRIWIDFNGDEDLDDTGEMVFEGSGNGIVTGDLDLPDCVNNIETRMRVSMQSNQFPTACATGFNGEVEDYTVDLESTSANNYNFTATPTAGLAPVEVQYTALYTGTDGNSADDFNWSWNFAGGTPSTSTLQNPSVTYAEGGDFNVSVEVTTPTGCVYTVSKQNYISISDYCSTQGNITTDEWIGRVAIADIDNTTGADGGYGNYTNISTDLFLGDTYTIDLEPEFASDLFNEYWRVWIDYNRDGDFNDADELAFDAGAATNSNVSGEITIPTTAQQGTTRMRVSMKYNNDTGAATPCETFTWGE
ncbi:MAG: GEVED domain-containing protein, partial [Chitinophagales bacterium]